MIRAVLDTNILVRGIIGRSTSVAGYIIDVWRRGQFELGTSEFILGEVRRTLDKPYFAARIGDSADEIVRELRVRTVVLEEEPVVLRVAEHWQDDLVLSAAVMGNADYLVTADDGLLRLGQHRSVAVIDPPTFSRLLRQQARET